MLTPSEQTEVRNSLARDLGNNDSVRTYVSTLFGRTADILREMPTTLTDADAQADYVVSYCLDKRWPPPPEQSPMEKLLIRLVSAGFTDLVMVRDRVRQGEAFDPTPDHVMAFWLRDTMPFFSRCKLRPAVKTLLAPNAQPILRIIGPERSGKTYTRELIDHVCNMTRNDVHVVGAEVAKGAGPSYSVEELADALVTPTTRDVSSRPPRSSSNYPATLCRWVLNAAIQTPGRWIYVLDGFNQADLQEETRQLVQALAQQIAGPGEFRKRMRLVLIDYDCRLPNVQLGALLDDRVPPVAALTSGEVADCLSAHYEDLATRGRSKGRVTKASLTKTADELLSEASAGGALCLQTLNDMLTTLRLADLS